MVLSESAKMLVQENGAQYEVNVCEKKSTEEVDIPGWASRAVLSAAPVMLSFVLSRVDLEESGVYGWLVVRSIKNKGLAYELLLSLGVEILACGFRHDGDCLIGD